MCGIYAMSSKNSFSLTKMYNGLTKLQHRGQDGFGIASPNCYIREKGKIQNIIENPKTSMAIGHVRYTTSGNSDDISQMQPLHKNDIFIVHNGNIPSIGKQFDTSFLLNLIDVSNNIEENLIFILNNIHSAYCIVVMTPNCMYVIRDRYGIRPLYYKQTNETIYIASETCCWESQENVHEVPCGTISKIEENTIKQIYKHPDSKESLCSLELLYMMSEKSMYKNILLSNIRQQLGEIVSTGDNFNTLDYTVVGIPNSGLPYAMGYANKLGLKHQNFITLSTNSRTFITSEDYRQNLCHKKFIFHPELKGKKIILVDDTIIRGTVIKQIIKNLIEIGVKEIHIRIPAPAIIDVNIYGIAIKNKENLLMNKYNMDNVCESLGINSIKFLSVEQLKTTGFFPENSYMEFFGIPFEK